MKDTVFNQKLVSFKEKLKAFFVKFGEKIGFKRNKWKILVYGVATIATLVTFPILLSWALDGDTMAEMVIKQVSALAKEDARVEYIVGETPTADGFALVIDGKVQNDCKIELDTASAGVKPARVYYESGNTTYEGFYPVTVFGVRHIDIRQQPTALIEKEDGTIELENLVVWAELSGAPKQLKVQDEHPEWDTTIVLSKDNYTVWQSDDKVPGGYAVNLSCGSIMKSFAFVTIGGVNYVFDNLSRIVTFANVNQGEESLTLFVTQPETNNSDGETGARGKYLYTDESGTEHIYDFAYYINGWESHFVSNATFSNGVEERLIGDDLQVTINGINFTASHSAWTSAILAL